MLHTPSADFHDGDVEIEVDVDDLIAVDAIDEIHVSPLPPPSHSHAHAHVPLPTDPSTSTSTPSRPTFPLLSIFFSEFDNTAGPVITCQAPSPLITRDEFEEISDFIIMAPEISHKLVTILTDHYRIIGYPMFISASRYDRNAYFFNIAMVFSIDTETQPYHPVLCKLANILETLELESGFLSQPSTRASLPSLLNSIFIQLNACGECSVEADAANKINLKLYPTLAPPAQVEAYHVPVWIKDMAHYHKTEWDLTLREVIPYIDHVQYVKRIAMNSGVHIDLVKKCLRQLLYYGCITLIDIFQYSNIYVCTDRIHELYSNINMQQICAQSVARVTQRENKMMITPLSTSSSQVSDDIPSLPSFPTLFRLYSSLHHSLPLSEFYHHHHLHTHNIDIRKWILFGLVNKLIRRIHHYPLWRGTNDEIHLNGIRKSSISTSIHTVQSVPNLTSYQYQQSHPPIATPPVLPPSTSLLQSHPYIEMLDGNHSMDEICVTYDRSYAEVDHLVRNVLKCSIISK